MDLIEFGRSKLYYMKEGTGTKTLLFFHGFGQDHTLFRTWVNKLKGDFTIYSFDLYYHGLSIRPNNRLSKSEWLSTFNEFLQKENISNFSICGYSLGGRFVLATAMLFPKNIEYMILLAPDGIYKSPWYRFATSLVFKGIFKFFMKRPATFNNLLNSFEKYKLANPSLIRFAKKELGPKENRIKVYQSWVYLKPLKYSKAYIIKSLNRSNIKTLLCVGSRDNIVPQHSLERVFSNISNTEIHITPAKHHELISKANLTKLMQLFENDDFL